MIPSRCSCPAIVDFRKGPDSLLSLVRDSGSDPFLCVGRDYVTEPSWRQPGLPRLEFCAT